jgi:hypothetical protein
MKYTPAAIPQRMQDVMAYLGRELQKIAGVTSDDAPRVLYAVNVADVSAFSSNNLSAESFRSANVIRISASVTQTLTGISLHDPWRVVYLFNIGVGRLVLLGEDANSSASSRFSLPVASGAGGVVNMTQNASVSLWYDASVYRWRVTGRNTVA